MADDEENATIQFEYKIEILPKAQSVELLNKIGADGWMLCCIVGTQAYFARPLMVEDEDDGSVS